MSWRLAKSLEKLTDEIETYYPETTIWNIGDEDHQNGYSDHNPTSAGVVCASDILSDGGLDLGGLAHHLITYPHPNLRYVIYNRKIYQRKNGFAPEDYHGKNAHTGHLHASVGNGPDGRSTSGYDDTDSWQLSELGKAPSKPSKPTNPTENLGDKMPTVKRGSKGQTVRILQALLGAWGWKVSVDGIFGPQTERAVRAFQDKHAKPVDGIVGRLTWAALLGL